jgi:hypothetical protein
MCKYCKGPKTKDNESLEGMSPWGVINIPLMQYLLSCKAKEKKLLIDYWSEGLGEQEDMV